MNDLLGDMRDRAGIKMELDDNGNVVEEYVEPEPTPADPSGAKASGANSSGANSSGNKIGVKFTIKPSSSQDVDKMEISKSQKCCLLAIQRLGKQLQPSGV